MRRGVLALGWMLLAGITATAAEPEKPLLRDFIGINGHFHFKPDLYKQVCRLVRNYHNINWDVKAPGDPITYPKNAVKFDWEKLTYGPWRAAGFEIDLCAQFGKFGGKEGSDYRKLWDGQEGWIEEYGYRLAAETDAEGQPLVTSIEVGNEPGTDFDDDLYQRLFLAMSKGIRRADVGTKVVTCTTHPAPADRYSKSLDETFGSAEMRAAFDVINVHTYAQLPRGEGTHPWARTYPEDPRTNYLTVIEETLEWRDKHAPGKEVWVTEFGWDAPSKGYLERRKKEFKKYGWQGDTEAHQAQWLVRSVLLFSAMDVDRAYLYFYNDEDGAGTHAASGITRNFEPKPSFWALKHLYETLGDYRFSRVVKLTADELFVYEFTPEKPGAPLIWVAWSPTGDGRSAGMTLQEVPGRITAATQSPLEDGPAPKVAFRQTGNAVALEVGETPVFLQIAR